MKMKTFAVIGLGRFGAAIAAQLFDMGHEVLAVDTNLEAVNAIADYVTKAVCADAKEESVLKELGIKNYDCVVVGTGSNITDSVLITLMLKEMGVGEVVCKARDAQHKKVLLRIGADKVIIPEHEAGIKTAIGLVSSNIMEIINFAGDCSVADVAVPRAWVGKSIAEINVRGRHGVNIVAVKDAGEDKAVNIAPSAEYVFEKDDIVVVIGKTSQINSLNDK